MDVVLSPQLLEGRLAPPELHEVRLLLHEQPLRLLLRDPQGLQGGRVVSGLQETLVERGRLEYPVQVRSLCLPERESGLLFQDRIARPVKSFPHRTQPLSP